MKYLNSNNKEEPNNSNTQLKGEGSRIKGINIFVGFCFKNYFRNLYYGHHRLERHRAFPVSSLLLTLVLCMCLFPNLVLADDSTVPKNLLLTGEDVEKVRPDIGVVVYASVLQMCHSQMDTYPVVFSLKAQQELQTDTFQYLGFGKPLYSVTHFVQKSDKDNLYNLGVIMYFTDATFRRCTVFCEFDYSIEGEQILVKQVIVKQLVPDIPKTLFAIVPADRVIDDLLQTYPTNVDILNWIVVNSLKFDEVPEIPSKQSYYIFAATFDRIGKGAKLQIRLSDDKNGLDGETGNCMDMDYEGWHVAIVRGEFELKTNQEFFIKIIYTPGDDVEPKLREPALIGVYSSDLLQVQGIGTKGAIDDKSVPNITGQEKNVISPSFKSNKLPVVNFEIGTVSGGSFTAPVWLKFYPVGTYDPDGKIVLFEMDMNGDGIYDVKEKVLTGSSYEFTMPGEYTASVRVTDDKGGITAKSKSFIINEVDKTFTKSVENQITVIPSDAWEETSIPWIKVWAPNGNSIVAKEVDSYSIPEGNFTSISPIISIEPQDENSIIGAIQVKMPESIHVDENDKGRVALAFYEDSYSTCTEEVESRWRFHSVDYDSKTDTYEAQMNHGCFVTWALVTLGVSVGYLVWDDVTRLLMTKKESDHFVLHYNRKEIPEATAKFTLNKLEEARTFLTRDISKGGLGLDYPSVPAKLDIYFVNIKSKESVNYGSYLESGKTSAKWMDLNLPSNIPNYDSNKMIATLTHELFHFIQYSKYNNSTYKWLNEALSTSIEFSFVKSKYFIPDGNSPILNDDLLKKGLKGLVTPGDGYSAGLFIDFLVHRYGLAIYSTILNECKRQIESGTEQNSLVAIQRAISRLGRKRYPSKRELSEMDVVWQAFTDAFIKEKSGSQLFDERLDRKIPYTYYGIRGFTIGEKEIVKKWTIAVPPLSLKPLASRIFNIKPQEWNDEDKAIIDCNVTYTPQEKISFDITTLISFSNKLGKKVLLPVQTRTLGRITDKTLDLTFTLNLEKKNRYNLLSFIPTGLGAKKKPGVAKGTYKFSCKLRKEERIEVSPEVPISTNAIDTYWWAYWKTAVEIKNSPPENRINVSPLGDLYQNAWSEWEPIQEQIMAISKRRDIIVKKLHPVINMHYKYREAKDKMQYTFGKAKSLSKGKENFLMEISNNYHAATNIACSYPISAKEIFSSIQTIGVKLEVLVSPNRLRYLHIRKSTKLPTQKDIQNALDNFHQSIAQISPCQNALGSFEKYWDKNEKEALEIIEEIKILYPSLNE